MRVGRRDVPYPLPFRRRSALFVTCLYTEEDGSLDYRGAVLERLAEHGPRFGFRALGIVAGAETPYPNGPESLLARHGFSVVRRLGRALIRDRYDELVYMERPLRS